MAYTSNKSNRGYVAPGREKLSTSLDKTENVELRKATPDLKENMEIGREGVEGMPNRWPDEFDNQGKEFKRVMLDFFQRCQTLNIDIMRAIALGFGLNETFFDQYVDKADNNMRLLHYPSVPSSVFSSNKAQVSDDLLNAT